MPDWTEYLVPTYNASVAFFHNLGQNMMFCDGHVEWVSKSKLITFSCQYYNPSNDHVSQGQTGANTPGGWFWADGKLVPGVDSNWSVSGHWTQYQFPGAPIYN